MNKLEKCLIEIVREKLEVSLAYERNQPEKVAAEIDKYKTDPVFSVFQMDTKEIVTSRTSNGQIMSITRCLGTAYEKMAQETIMSGLGLTLEQIEYSATIQGEERVLECRILFSDISNNLIRSKVEKLASNYAKDKKFKGNKGKFIGLAFEMRYCYQIGDSKRIQADDHMAQHLFSENILPIMLVFCSTALQTPIIHFRNKSKWIVLEGHNSYKFLKSLTEFDLHTFLKGSEMQDVITKWMTKIKQRLH